MKLHSIWFIWCAKITNKINGRHVILMSARLQPEPKNKKYFFECLSVSLGTSSYFLSACHQTIHAFISLPKNIFGRQQNTKKKWQQQTGNRKVEADVFFAAHSFILLTTNCQKKNVWKSILKAKLAKNLQKWELKPEMLAFCFFIPIQRF